MSFKKLQDLLNSGAQGGSNFNAQTRSPSFGQPQFSPLGTQLASTINRSPSYPAIPGVQQMFYHPPAKQQQQETVCPSPMFQFPTKKNPPVFNSLFQGSRFTAAETNNQTHNQTTLEPNNLSNSLNSLINQLQNRSTSQPRNLEELLQRSLSSMPSNSPFTQSAQSPFLCGNNSNLHHSFGSEISKILNNPMTLLETSLQSNNFLGSQNGMNQNNEAINKTLVLQLAQILKQESESKIKSAIAELILKYRALGLLNNLSGNEMLDLQSLISSAEATTQANTFQHQQNHQEMIPQNTVPISHGLSMNTVVRNDMPQNVPANLQMFKPALQPTRVDATRRELFAMSETPMPFQQSMDSFQRNNNIQQGNMFQPNQPQMNLGSFNALPISPVNVLDQEMKTLSLSANNLNPANYTNYGMNSMISAPEKMDELATEDLSSMLKLKVPSDEELPGIYNKSERINRILKYKNKIRKWRVEHPIKRAFKGRSLVAGQKPRIKGKFVTQEEYVQHLRYECKKEYQDSVKEEDF